MYAYGKIVLCLLCYSLLCKAAQIQLSGPAQKRDPGSAGDLALGGGRIMPLKEASATLGDVENVSSEIISDNASGTDNVSLEVNSTNPDADNVSLQGSSTNRSDFRSFDCNKDRVLVYSVPKTATTTFEYSMRKLCNYGIAALKDTTMVQGTYPRGIKSHGGGESGPAVALDFMSKVPEGGRIFVLTFTRNPFERWMSAFFQLLGDELTDYDEAEAKFEPWMRQTAGCVEGEWWWNDFLSLTNSTLDEMVAGWHHNRVHLSKWVEGHQLEILLLREEDVDQWPTILKHVIPGFTIEPANLGEAKKYEHLYRKLKEHYAYHEGRVECFLRSAFLKFYTETEIRMMVQKARTKKVTLH